jgi:hypothetical protein
MLQSAELIINYTAQQAALKQAKATKAEKTEPKP